MKRILFAVCVVGIAAQAVAQQVSYQLKFDTIVIRARVNGKMGTFAVCAERADSVVSTLWLKDAKDVEASPDLVDVKIYSQAPITTLQSNGIDGVIGSDLLKDYQVGIDLLKTSLHFWKKGSGKDLEKWLDQGKENALKSIPISRLSNGVFTVECELKNDSRLFILAISQTRLHLFENALLSADIWKTASIDNLNPFTGRVENTKVGMTSSFSVLKNSYGITPFELVSRELDEWRDEKFVGVFSAQALPSLQSVFDFPNNRIVYRPQSGETLWNRYLTWLLGVPVHIEDGSVVIGSKIESEDSEDTKKWRGFKLISADTQDLTDAYMLFSNPDKAALKLFSELFKLKSRSRDLKGVKDGVEASFTVNP